MCYANIIPGKDLVYSQIHLVADLLLSYVWCVLWTFFIVYFASFAGIPFPAEGEEGFPSVSLQGIIFIVFAGPFLENCVLTGLIHQLRKKITTDGPVIIICGFIAGGLHSIVYVGWGVTTFLSFALMTRLYLRYRHRKGFVAALLLHILLNTSSILPVLF